MRFVPWKWNTPCESFATDREIVESTFDETDYFIHAEARCDGLRVIGVPLEQTVFKTRQAEKVIFFFYICGFGVMNRAVAIF